MRIREMRETDADAVLAIYAEGVETGHATFESEPPDWNEFDASKMAAPRLVAEDDGAVLGWAVLSPVSDRCVYGGIGEVTVYVSKAARGRGVGKALLEAMVAASEAEGIWTLQAGIFPENESSVRLHERCGFRVVGRRERVGRMGYGPLAGRWRDTLLLERRSDVVGVD
ncbi:N-acetyltransferase [Marinicauda salina]|uniref:N-acetyltransferase n=1 Tax=Marinicauda salina TaxID=2135793 RepID=A0A2U2BR57_9PROT|nr:GNAT family N-acetyltransferase [Marinicauda salina]PWE16468.1 N-acetyltransferase [Marinicauda salina]